MKNKINIAKILKISISLLNKREKFKLLKLSILSLISSSLDFISIISIYPFLNIILNKNIIYENQNYYKLWNLFGSPNLDEFVTLLSFLVILLILFASFLNFFTQYQCNMFAADCQIRLGKKLFRYFTFVDYEWHIRRNSVKLMNLFTIHLTKFSRSIIRQIPLLLGYISSLIIPIATLILLSPRYGLLFVSVFAFILFYFLRWLRKKTNFLSNILKLKLDELNILLIESIQGIKDVKLSSSEDNFIRNYEKIYKDFCFNTSIVDNFNQLPVNAVLMTSQLIMVGLGTLLFLSNISSSSLVGIMSTVALIAFKIIPSLNKLGNGLNTISNAFIFTNVLDELFLELSSKSDNNKNSFTEKNKTFWNKVNFKDVSYKYPESSNFALKNINLEIRKGYHYGFVGFSGSGKSTTIDIFNGLISPFTGKVLIDGKPLLNFGHREWQSKIGYVPQQPKISDQSIKENIAFGLDYSEIDNDRILSCIEMVGLTPFLKTLPHGTSTLLGDSGKFISGGQKQLIAIARALYKNPEILILDEATSSLDSISENLVRNALKNLHGKISLLTIAHQFSNIKEADHIFLFEKGKLIDEGNYIYLINNSSLFKKFVENN